MKGNNRSIDPKLIFLAGWLLGRRGRRRNGVGCLLLFVALFAGMTALVTLLGAPFVWQDSRQVARLPRPSVAELAVMAPGTQALVAARISPDLAVDAHGLALFFVEVKDAATGAATDGWRVETPVQPRIGMVHLDGTPLLVQTAAGARLLNANTLDTSGQGRDGERRYTGYLPGQVLALQGVWEGDSLFTAEKLYAGTLEDYVRHTSRLPGYNLLMGAFCSVLALVLLVAGAVLRLLGN